MTRMERPQNGIDDSDQMEPEAPDPHWEEVYEGGSAEAERLAFEELAIQIMQVQLKNQRSVCATGGVGHGIDRALHSKSILGVEDAVLTFRSDLPEELRAEFAQPNATYRTMVRFSNASGIPRADRKRDLRGVALRITVSPTRHHDLLMVNYPVSHAPDARRFVKFAKATAGGGLARIIGVVALLISNPRETAPMLFIALRGLRAVRSVAAQTYWSRGAIRWGETLAVRYILRPVNGTHAGARPNRADPDFLFHEVAERLAHGPVRFELCVQKFMNNTATPIENTAVRWNESISPLVPVGELMISQRNLGATGWSSQADALWSVNFNPWNTTDRFRPLGNLNRARKSVYDASAAQRHTQRWQTNVPLRNVVLGAVARATFRVVNRWRPWYRLGLDAALLNLQVIRHVLFQANLIDTESYEAPPRARKVPTPPDDAVRVARTTTGRDNDLSNPMMGAVGAAFGRNLPPDFRPELDDEPNPIVVSDLLLQREVFRPATSLNILAAAWLQFQVHDWVNHARYRLGIDDVTVRLPPGYSGHWSNTQGGPTESVMRIAGNIPPLPAADAAQAPFRNATSFWGDASELYGADSRTAQTVCEEQGGPKLRLSEGYLPVGLNGADITGFSESWWLGLSGLHTLFAREHNVLCDELRAEYRGWGDERIYRTARLIVTALIAKIQTLEWTPAVLATETIKAGMNANWYGPPSSAWLTRLGTWLIDANAIKGITKMPPNHHGVPFSLSEEFVAVYRMHPMLPDDYVFRDQATGEVINRSGFLEIQGKRADAMLRRIGLDNMLYSFGVAHSGAISLHNYPRALRRFERDGVNMGEIIDLSVVDLIRTRRRGVARYNDFRAGMRKPRITRWEDLSDNPVSVERLREVYKTIDDVDTMVGLFAETPPEGFAFSDTAFRIFILTATRRIQSDRFLTVDFRPQIYSPFGMDWVANNTMSSVIRRHCPELRPLLPGDENAFAPWGRGWTR